MTLGRVPGSALPSPQGGLGARELAQRAVGWKGGRRPDGWAPAEKAELSNGLESSAAGRPLFCTNVISNAAKNERSEGSPAAGQ